MPSKKKRRGRIAPAEQLRLAALAEEIAGVGHWYWHLGNGRIYWSDETARIHGVVPGRFEPSLEATIAAYHPEDRAAVLQHLADAQAETAAFDYEARLARPHGGWRRVQVTGRCQTNARGEAEALVGVIRDITDRGEAGRGEQEAPVAEDAAEAPAGQPQPDHLGALETLIECIDHGVLFLDADLHVRAANQAFCTLSGIPERVIATWPPLSVILDHAIENGFRDPEDPDRPLDPIAYLAAVEQGRFGPLVLPCGDGRLLDHLCVPLPDGGRLLIYREAAAIPERQPDRPPSDNTAEGHDGAEAETAALPPLPSLLTALGRKLDLPIKGVINAAALLLDSDLDEEQRQFALMAQEAGADLVTILDQYLTLSSMAAGKPALDVTAIDLPALVEETVAAVAARAAGKGIEVSSYIAADVPAALAGDPARVQRILLHLVRNALRFTEEGGVALEVTRDPDAAAAGDIRLRFDVADTGVGMPQGQIAALEAGPDAKAGGLGLLVCRHLAEAMGGRLGIAGEPGQGCRFWFTAAFDRMDGAPTMSWFEAPGGPLPVARILVVDDNPVSRVTLEKQLQDMGLRAESVGDARSALDLLDRSAGDAEPFAAAIIDQHMPEVDGVELCRLIREPARQSGLRLVLASTSQDAASDAQARRLHADFALAKPLSARALAACLDKVFHQAAAESAPEIEAPAPEATVPAAEKSLHILLVDDDPLNRRLVVELLADAGHRVEAVGTGYEATEAFRDMPYDLVVMDIQMPQMDGLETARRIRESGHHRADVPIIVMTGRALDGDRDRCLQAGANDYIVKPVAPPVLLEKVRHWGGIEPPAAAADADGEAPAGLDPAAPNTVAS